MKDNANEIVLESTGRAIYANKGIVGISPDGQVFEGYDGYLCGSEYASFTDEEREELSLHMIDRWKFFAENKTQSYYD